MTRIGLVALLVAGCGAAVAAEVEWRTDLEAARQEAARTGKPLMIVFR